MRRSVLSVVRGCALFLHLCSHLVAAGEGDRWIAESRRATIAKAKAYNLANPRNTKARPFGPQLYEAPFICCQPDVLIPQPYIVNLVQSHSITEHQATIARDLRSLIWFTFTLDLETVFYVKNVDEELLVAIRSDPGVWLVSCDKGDILVDREADWANEDSPEWNSDNTFEEATASPYLD